MSMQQGNLNLSWSGNNSFYGYISNEAIYCYDGQILGVTSKKYNEVEQALLKCKNRLIELGEIKIPKTQEEIIKEQTEMLEKQGQALTQMLETCQKLQQQIEDKKNEHATTKGIDKLSTAGYEGASEPSPNEGIGNSRPEQNKDKGRCNTSISKNKK